jgi:hypothetical protein
MTKTIVGVAAGIMVAVCSLIALKWVIERFDAIEASLWAWPPRFVVAARRNLRLRKPYHKALT